MLHHGDCIEVMAGMEAASVDAIVTDPPYGLEFMGKSWDSLGKSGVQKKADGGGGDRRAIVDADEWGGGKSNPFSRSRVRWQHGKEGPALMQEWHHRWATEALRVAKPGAYLLAFGGTRTYHRLAVAIEDAGWIIRDCLVWAYAQGFPKGRANLKPAWEPIVMARKPGTLRPLAIDECRIPHALVNGGNLAENPQLRDPKKRAAPQVTPFGKEGDNSPLTDALGRWPANLILTDPIFDGGIGGVIGGGVMQNGHFPSSRPASVFQANEQADSIERHLDPTTYSRFFLIPKATRSEREPVFGDVTPRRETAHRRTGAMDTPYLRGETVRRNFHPTVKPIDLMRHLVRLVTPAGGTVLDPFLGSGTTAIAAEMEGFGWIGIEKEAEYIAIAEARLQGVQRGLGLVG